MTATPVPFTLSTILAKVVAGVVGVAALAAGAWGTFLVVISLGESSDDDSLAGLAAFIGVVVIVLALPVLGLCAAVVISRNRMVVGVCGLLLAMSIGLVTFLSLVTESSLVGVFGLATALAMAVSSVLTLVAPAPFPSSAA